MAENLRTVHYNNGDPIPTGLSNSEWWPTQKGAFAIYPYDSDNESRESCAGDCSEVYGNLYNWEAVDDERGICPEGFHVPTDEEWSTLVNYLGPNAYSELAGNAALWNSGGISDTPSFGSTCFNALPSGYRDENGKYVYLGDYTRFWSSSEKNIRYAWHRKISHNRRDVYRGSGHTKSSGFSVRCLKGVFGCTDNNACNFDSDATIEDGSCLYLDCNNECGGTAIQNECGCTGGSTDLEADFCYGCTNPGALNYNPNAFINDDSCIYSCIDFDGNHYKTINIGRQTWMAENLKTTHYNNGDPIPTGFNIEWGFLSEYPTATGAYAVYPFGDDEISKTTCNVDCSEVYGNLYNWFAVEDNRGVCPDGFHVPTDEEWMELESTLGMPESELYNNGNRGSDQGSQLAGNAELWNSGDLVDNPSFGASGFYSLPAGNRDGSDVFYWFLGYYSCFWSSSEYYNLSAWYRDIDYGSTGVSRGRERREYGFSIRCVMKNYSHQQIPPASMLSYYFDSVETENNEEQETHLFHRVSLFLYH